MLKFFHLFKINHVKISTVLPAFASWIIVRQVKPCGEILCKFSFRITELQKFFTQDKTILNIKPCVLKVWRIRAPVQH